jgi:hypothetical protein
VGVLGVWVASSAQSMPTRSINRSVDHGEVCAWGRLHACHALRNCSATIIVSACVCVRACAQMNSPMAKHHHVRGDLIMVLARLSCAHARMHGRPRGPMRGGLRARAFVRTRARTSVCV